MYLFVLFFEKILPVSCTICHSPSASSSSLTIFFFTSLKTLEKVDYVSDPTKKVAVPLPAVEAALTPTRSENGTVNETVLKPTSYAEVQSNPLPG